MATRIAPGQISNLDPHTFMAVIGKRVIHPGGRASTQALLRRARITGPDRVLDVGCGVATTAIQIARRHGARVAAADISPLMLERAQANARDAGLDGRVAVEEGDILDLRFPDGGFDVVIAEADHHVRRPAQGGRRAGAGGQAGRPGAGRPVLLAHAADVRGQRDLPWPGAQNWGSTRSRTGSRCTHRRPWTALRPRQGPFEMMTPRGILADEGLAINARAAPYLGYIVVAGMKPR
jgi:SAM-dependent methyltransferase